MDGKHQATIIEKWESGDSIYAAVRDYTVPAGIQHMVVNGHEYPIGELSYLDVIEGTFFVKRWLKRGEHVPMPIKGFNY